MSTLKHRIGKAVLLAMPFNRRTFDILRYETGGFLLHLKNVVSPRHRATISRLQRQTNLSVNLASGGKGLDGWINTEFSRAKDTTLVLDLRRKIPLASGSAKRVIAEHVLEHLDFKSDALRLASEVYRILQNGGVFRVIVPDCERFLRAYVAGDRTAWQDLSWDVEAMPPDIYTPMHIINHTFHQDGEHLFGYDFETLSYLLKKAGFSRIERMSYRVSIDEKLAIDQENHAPYSLYVDAVK